MDPKKSVILEAAKQTFSLYGFKGTTMGHIAKLAGVGKGTLYLYFTSKEELLHEIIRSLTDEMKHAADEALQKQELASFERIHTALYNILMFRKEHELLIKLFREEREFGNPVMKQALDLIEHESLCYIASHVERAVAAGLLAPCDPDITAFVLFKLYLALVHDWGMKHPPLDNEKISELLQLYVMKGLSAR
ncbi:transcriptional regulator, TetR family [Paenibacillus sp. UNCCL117]|uniref:TetR/AcrR family transcriptional regulator n=1 Tax=unclassified Paenibacillus TaxID=185978 RepID=UPI000890D06E|nr:MULTISPECIES: TetR/AcrR family transcriptional regulator [unclassified Paenibacillus]SDC67203.1 DNA-binding transcriptional regulator, AcrR family [Paenibacillus sp. cl123]SFW23247.1 transcriptional regulator, TetR family [Paenibacillus sp. UNCCL117]